MITASILFTSVGFWCCYQTSQKAALAAPLAWETWLRAHKQQAKLIGLSGFLVGLLVSIQQNGLGSGIFAYLISLTCIASLIIILAPLGLLNKWSIATTFLIMIVLEISL